MQGISLMLYIHVYIIYAVVLFQYNACIIANYDTIMRMINEVHNIQTRYKTEYEMQKNKHTNYEITFTY